MAPLACDWHENGELMSLIDSLETLREHANNFITHWMDDDDPEDHARALEAEREVDAAHIALDDALKAAGLMLAALEGLLQPCTFDLTPTDWQRAIDAATQAHARGITPATPAPRPDNPLADAEERRAFVAASDPPEYDIDDG